MPPTQAMVRVILDPVDLELIDKLCTNPNLPHPSFQVRRADVVRQAVVFYLQTIRRMPMADGDKEFMCEKCEQVKLIGNGQPMRGRKEDGSLALLCFECCD
jgi:hypothetical protein